MFSQRTRRPWKFNQACRGGQLRDRWALEDQPGRDQDARLFGAADDLDAQNGIPAQLEEIVMDTDLFHAQDLGPDARQNRLCLVVRRDVVRLELTGEIRGGQCLAIELAVGVKR